MHAHPYSYTSWKDPTILSQIYVPEVADMLKRITGGTTVITEALLLRSVLWSEQDALATHAGHGEQSAEEKQKAEQEANAANMAFPQFIGFSPSSGNGASPAPKIHQDYTPAGARAHIRHYHPALASAAAEIITAQDSGMEVPRWALYSIWRPLKPIKRDPLELADARTFGEGDYVTVDVRTPNLGLLTNGVETESDGGRTHNAEAYVSRYGEGHQWWWVSGQRPEEVLVIGLFDSGVDREGGGKGNGGVMHSAIELEGAEGEEARESLEVRCLVVW